MNDSELHDAITEALLRRLDTCSVAMASRPYLVACWQMANGEVTVDHAALAAFTVRVTATLETLATVHDPEAVDRDRFMDALLFATELATRGLPAAPDQTNAITLGTVELDAAVRALPALPAAAAPEVSGVAVAGWLAYRDVTVPLPLGAEPQWTGHHPVYGDDGGSVWALFFVAGGSVDELHAFYKRWAHDEGWMPIEATAHEILMDISLPTVSVAKLTCRCGIFLRTRPREVSVMVRLDRTSPELYNPLQVATFES